MGKSMENFTEQKRPLGLYDPQFEHDACGIGAVVDIKGRKSHQTVSDAPATASASCCRSATVSSRRWPTS